MKRGYVLHHNGPPADCLDRPHTRCVAYWAAVRSFHMAAPPNGQGWSDIAYSFGVCPHGMRLTGRGWNKNQFANGTDLVGTNDGPDSEWYTVLVFIGIGEAPTDQMVNAVIALIDEGRNSGRCANRVLPHNAFKQKACPGPEFTTYAQLWDNRALVAPTQEEDDMPLDATDKKFLTDLQADQRKWLAEQLGKTAAVVSTGSLNELADPDMAGWGWLANDPTSLNDLAARFTELENALANIDTDVALTPDQVTMLATQIAAVIPDGLADAVADKLHTRLAG